MGANAVIMMRFDSAEIGQTMSEIVAYGTAAVIERDAGMTLGAAAALVRPAACSLAAACWRLPELRSRSRLARVWGAAARRPVDRALALQAADATAPRPRMGRHRRTLRRSGNRQARHGLLSPRHRRAPLRRAITSTRAPGKASALHKPPIVLGQAGVCPSRGPLARRPQDDGQHNGIKEKRRSEERSAERVSKDPDCDRKELSVPGGDRRQGGDVDAVARRFGDQRERVGALAHARQGPQQGRAGAAAAMRRRPAAARSRNAAAKASTSARDNVAAVTGMW